MQHSVAVVQPRQYQAARQSERKFGRQKMADVLDGLDVIVACPGHRCRVAIERQTSIENNSEDLHLVSNRQIDSSDCHGR